jgi:hypothetical protein
MNSNYNRVPTRFGPETGFEVRLSPPALWQARQETEFKRLQAQLLSERLALRPGAQAAVPLQRAAGEAAALAWVTRYPLLVFPFLFQEKADAALAQAERQERIRERSRVLLAA